VEKRGESRPDESGDERAAGVARGLAAAPHAAPEVSDSNTGRVRLILYAACVLFVLGGIAIAVAVTGRRPPAIRVRPRWRLPARLDLALVASVAAIIAVTFVPTRGGIDFQLTPLSEIIAAFTPPLQRSHLLEVAGNVFLFAPLGVVLFLRGLRLNEAFFAGVVCSIGIEVAQLLVPGRTTSVDDVLLNALGAVLGYSLATLWFQRREDAELESP
jgi:glycopeptide antibiotics resistance protein